MDGKGGIMMCKLKGWMDKGGHYDVEMKGCMQKGGIKMFKRCIRIWVHPSQVIFADFTGFEYVFLLHV